MPLGVLKLFYFAQLANTMPQFGFPVYPSANRPSYAPNPSGSLISQIVPPGKPWPANPEDYNSFSQTTQRPNVTPLWATTLKTQMPTIDDRLPDIDVLPDHKRWSRPTIIFHEPFLRRNATTTTTESRQIVESASTASTILQETSTPKTETSISLASSTTVCSEVASKPSEISTVDNLISAETDTPSKRETPTLTSAITIIERKTTSEQNMINKLVPIRLPDFELYTSAPLKSDGQHKAIKANIGQRQQPEIGVANLLPEGASVTIPKTVRN